MTRSWSRLFRRTILLRKPILERLEDRTLPSLFTVLNTNDSGSGSLRQAITDANNSSGADLIQFNIGSGVQTIIPLSALPTITDPVEIDGTSEPDYAGIPRIELDGEMVPNGTTGLAISSGNSTILGLAFNRFPSDGQIQLFGSQNIVQANYFGLHPDGTAAGPNSWRGISIFNSSDNTIGGTTVAARNVISNGYDGVYITGSGTHNLVEGNYIGTDPTGEAGRDIQFYGVRIEANAGSNTIGGSAAGAGNVISASDLAGIAVIKTTGGSSPSNVIQGNKIGTDALGKNPLANGHFGDITLQGAPNNLIGGTVAGARNLLAASSGGGIQVGSTGNLIQGNYVGTDVSGTLAIPNRIGILVFSSGNTVGGSAAGAGNLISGNTNDGVWVNGVSGVYVQGNKIGTDVTGTTFLPNTGNGVDLLGGSQQNYVGTDGDGVADATEGNLISGNGGNGVAIQGSGTNGNVVAGNIIGLDANVAQKLHNGSGGVNVFGGAQSNRIGTDGDGVSDSLEGNIISGNDLNYGIQLTNPSTEFNVVAGNLIGTNSAGAPGLGNNRGVLLSDGAQFNRIGSSGNSAVAPAERNVIAGNSSFGVSLAGSASHITSNNVFAGNYVGLDPNGAPLGNASYGFFLFDYSQNNRFGTDKSGAAAVAERNVISANNGSGIGLIGSHVSGNLVAGNYIGTQADGTGDAAMAYGNLLYGIQINNASNNTIGGLTASARNIVISNHFFGIAMILAGASGNQVLGNWVGVDVQGQPFGNLGPAVQVYDVGGNTIGGSEPGAANVLAASHAVSDSQGNVYPYGVGVFLQNPGAVNNIVQGNLIGTSPAGVPGGGFGNDNGGVWILMGGQNQVGGQNFGEGNLIAGNHDFGVSVSDGGSGNLVEGNTVTDNAGAGFLVVGSSTTGNTFRGNAVDGNGRLGIDIGGDGVTPNDDQDGDSGPNQLQNYPVLATAAQVGTATAITGTLDSLPSTTFTLDFYASPVADPSGYGQGAQYLGSAMVSTDSTGNANFSATVGLVDPAAVITATATDPTGNTSEFSAALGQQASFANLTLDAQGALTYTASTSIANALTVSLTNGVYTITDTAELLQVGGARASSCTGSGTHTVTCPQGAVTSLFLDLGDGNDTANIESIGDPTTVSGGQGDDTINVSPAANDLGGIDTSLTIDGGTGSDSATLNDQGWPEGTTYTITATTVRVASLRRLGITYTGLEGLTLNPAGTAGSGSTVEVTSTAAGCTTVVNGSAGDDRFLVAQGLLETLLGPVMIQGGAGADALLVDASLEAGTGIPFTLTATQLSGDDFAPIGYSGLASLGFTTAHGSTVTIGSTAAGCSTTISGPTGANTFNVGQGDVSGLAGSLTIHGDGNDSLVVDASNEAAASQTHTLTATQLSGDGMAAITYSGLNALYYYAPAGSTVRVDSSAVGCLTTLGGLLGNMRFFVGEGDLSGIAGPLTFLGDGTAMLDVDASNEAAASQTHTLTATQLSGDGMAAITYSGLNALYYYAPAGSTVRVDSSAAGCLTTLGGLLGNTRFFVGEGDLGGIAGPLTFLGDGYAALDVNDANGGLGIYTLTSQDLTGPTHAPISYSGLASCTLETALDSTVMVESTAAGCMTSITGSAGDDAITVSSTGDAFGNLDGIAGDLTIDAEGGKNELVLSDYASALANPNVVVSADAVTGLAGPANGTTIHYAATGGTFGDSLSPGLQIVGSNAASDNILLVDVPAGSAYEIDLAGGDDQLLLASLVPVAVSGGDGADTFVGPDQDTGWLLTGAGSGTLANSNVSFSGFENLTAGSGADAFALADGASLNGLLDGGDGMNTVSYAAFSTGVSVDLGQGQATALGGITRVQNVQGSAHNDFLVGDGSDNTIATGGGRDTVHAGAGNDVIVLSPHQGSGTTIDGGDGSDTLVGADVGNSWRLTGAAAGALNGRQGPKGIPGIGFSSTEVLQGGQAKDTFTFEAGASGFDVIDGGHGTNTLDYTDYPGPITVSLAARTAPALGMGFKNIQVLRGTQQAGNTLIGVNGFGGPKGAPTRWTISGVNTGTVLGYTFSSFDHLEAGSGDDVFAFGPGGQITGLVDGGTGINALNYQSFPSVIVVNLSSAQATATGGFANIGSLTGSSSVDTLIGPDDDATWMLRGTNSGTVADFSFRGIEDLSAGAGADDFQFADGARVTGRIDGGGGQNTLDYSAYTSGITVNLLTGRATGVVHGIHHFVNVFGGSGDDQLSGVFGSVLMGNAGNDALTGAAAGDDILVGGAGDDLLRVGPLLKGGTVGRHLLIGGDGSDTLHGGGGDDLLISGTTDFDTDLSALGSILAEWVRTDQSYSQRIGHLRGMPGGRNQVYLNPATVHDDGTADVLQGGGGLDWFWANLSQDTLLDRAPGEQVN
jgi:parallel beta-helix repeat protein